MHASRQPVDTPIALFVDGTLFLEDLLAEIRGATRSVTVTNYIFRAGRMSNDVLDALAERAAAGVEVRLLLDARGTSKIDDERVEAVRAAGGRVATFRPFAFKTILRYHKRTHARAIMVDGEVGYTGGLAFDDGWLGDGSTPDQWRDVMFKLGGEMARATQDQFNGLWRQTDGEILSGPAFYPTAVDEPAATVEPAPSSWFLALFHTPSPDLAADLQDLIWLSIAGATSHILVATPYYTPDADIREALMAAARRGVQVELLMPGPHTDAKPIQAAARAHYASLLESGIRIFEYQPGRFHEKTFTVDGRWSVVGSANMDNRSATLNVENVFAIEDRALAAALEGEFAFSKGRSVEVTVESWDPNPLERLYHNAARLFAKQY